MKKLFFFFAMLAGVAASAQSHINIQMISATYTGLPAVKFRVSWSSVPTVTGQIHNAKIWVWIDYRKIENNQPSGTWARAEITATPAVSSSPTSTATLEAGNNKGFWLNGVIGSYSATVTATLNIPANTKFNWCAYTSDAPPRMLSNNNGTLILGGTPPFELSDASGTNTYTVPNSAKTVTATVLLAAVASPVYITDRTGCKGLLGFGNPVLQGSCTFTQPSLVNTFSAFPADYSASTFVSLIDERDLNIYTAVKIGGRWWMGQNLNYQKDLTYFDQHSKPNGTTGSNPALRGGFWCPAGSSGTVPITVCNYWGALYAWETAMMLDGKGTWTEVSGSYCTGAANSANCKVNQGRRYSSGTTIGGRGICPPNWHVPTDFEWGVLFDAMESSGGTAHQSTSADGSYVGINASTRSKAKCSGTSSNTNPVWSSGAGTDNYNFRVLGSDNRNADGGTDGSRSYASCFGGSTAYNTTGTWLRKIHYDAGSVQRERYWISAGIPLRCIRD